MHSALMGPWEPDASRKPESEDATRRPAQGNGNADRWGPAGRGSNQEPPNPKRGQRCWRDEERSSVPPVRREGPGPGPPVPKYGSWPPNLACISKILSALQSPTHINRCQLWRALGVQAGPAS